MFGRHFGRQFNLLGQYMASRQFGSGNLSWTSIDPKAISEKNPVKLQNFVNGQWKGTKKYQDVLDPMNGEKFMTMPDTDLQELDEFAESLKKCPKSGLHNPLKNPERYLLYGEVCRKASELMNKEEVMEHFVNVVQRVMPKSYPQVYGEVRVTTDFLENFCGDQVRFLAHAFQHPGDHNGQKSTGYRWPYGPVLLISPFNFPIEIPVLQLMGALFMGNKVLLKANSKTTIVMEEFLRLLHHCGMPKEDVDLIHMRGSLFEKIYEKAPIRMTQFTGGFDTAERLAGITQGKMRVEDAGFNFKVLGPDVQEIEFVAAQCDQDAYAATGQKCSAESILFIHENWRKTDLVSRLKTLVSKRSLKELTIGPILSHTTEEIQNHVNSILKLDGAKVLWGGKELAKHTIPKCYGAFEPTAMSVPIKHFDNPEVFPLLTTEIFGPFQILVDYKHSETEKVLEILERIPLNLTCAITSNDQQFVNKFLGQTVNGTTYCGIRGRTTGAPQNHWFGPCGDPRGAGIGTPYAIQFVWSCHREIVEDIGPVPIGFFPKQS